MTKQYVALLAADGATVCYTDDGIDAIAAIACEVNSTNENIGARRLHTIMEKLLEDISFDAPEDVPDKVIVDKDYVEARLKGISSNVDLSRYIL